LLAGSQVLSRLLGVVREAVLAAQVGRGAEADAYLAAFAIPDLLNHFLAGGALTIAFIPLYHRAREQGGAPAAERLFATVLGTVGVLALLATGLAWVSAESLVAWQFPRFDAAQQAHTVRLTRIVLPAQVFFLTGGILRAVLMAEGRFGAQAVSGLLYNLAIIAGGLLVAPVIGVEGFAWGALLGSIAGPFGVGWLQLRRRGPVRVRVAFADRDFLAYLALAAPLMVGVTLATVDEWFGRWFGGLGPEGTMATLGYARKLMQTPVAVVGQALGTAALPTLSRLFAEGQHARLNDLVHRTLTASAGLGLLAAAAVLVTADALVTLVYVRGAFSAADGLRVADALRVYTAAIPGFVIQAIAVRAFYARGEMWRPMLLGTGIGLLAIPLYLQAVTHGAPGLAAAASLAIATSAVATLAYARRRFGGPVLLPLLVSVLRSTLIAAAAAAVASVVPDQGADALGALATLALRGLAFSAVALPLAWWIGDPELRDLFKRLPGSSP
jgi:putative peptidoglycan lipid II flippase